VLEALWKLTPNDRVPQDFPDGIVFVNFGGNVSSLESACNKIISAFGEVKVSTDPTPLSAVERILSRRKALLVLDAPELINDDLTPLLDFRGNCCVLITSTNRVYANIDNTAKDILPLPLEHAVNLFKNLSGQKTAKDKIIEEICEQVGRSPFTIRLIASHLLEYGGRVEDYLRDLQEDSLIDFAELQKNKPILDKNTTDLTPAGQQALAMIGLLANHSFKTDVLADMMEMKLQAIDKILKQLVDTGLLLHQDDDRYQVGYTLIHTYAQGRVHMYGREYENKAIDKLIQHFFRVVQKTPKGELPEEEESHILVALQRIKDRYDDDRSAYQQMIDFVNLLDPFWEYGNEYEKRIQWLEEAWFCAEQIGYSLVQADFATRIGRTLGWLGRLDSAFEWMAKAEAVLKRNKSSAAKEAQARMYIQRSSLYFMKKNIDTTEKDCLRGLKLSSATDHRNFAEGYNLLGVIQAIKGDLSQALDAFEKSRKSWEALKDDYQIARVDDNIGSALFYQGHIAQARAVDEKSLRYWEKNPKRIELAMALTNLGVVDQCQGEYQSAFDLHKRAIEISDRIGVQRIRALTRVNIAWPCIALENFNDAETYLNESLEIQTDYNIKENEIEAQRALAEVALGRQRGAEALELAQNALTLAQKAEDPLEEGTALRILGKAHHLNGNLEQAREYLEKSLSVLKDEYKYESFLTLQALIKLYESAGETEKAQMEVANAQALSDEMGLRRPKA
jgi:tetratricopeptide (TPR) repeat protein